MKLLAWLDRRKARKAKPDIAALDAEARKDESRAEMVRESLIGYLSYNENSEVRKRSLTLLLDLVPPQERLQYISIGLADADEDVRSMAVFATEFYALSDGLDQLLEALRDSSWKVREAAAQALAALKNPRAGEHLAKALADSHPGVRQHAAEGLHALADPAYADRLIGAMAAEEYTPALNHMVAAVGKCGGTGAYEALLLVLDRNVGYTVPNAYVVRALADLGDIRAIDPILDLVTSKSPMVRQYCANSLGQLGAAGAVDSLILMLNDPIQHVRDAAEEALRKIGGQKATAALDAFKSSSQTLTDQKSAGNEREVN